MAQVFCDHLDEYGAQYTRTEAGYRQCVNLLDRIVAEGPRPELIRLVVAALAEWSAEDGKLREMLVEVVRTGQVRVPRGILHHGSLTAKKDRREARRTGHPVCATCGFAVPRLEYPEWKIAHNGSATFRGVEFPPGLPVSA